MAKIAIRRWFDYQFIQLSPAVFNLLRWPFFGSFSESELLLVDSTQALLIETHFVGWKTIPPCRACRSFHSLLRGVTRPKNDIMTSSKSASPFPTTSRQRSVWHWCRGTRVLEVPAGLDGGHVLRFSKVPHLFYLFSIYFSIYFGFAR